MSYVPEAGIEQATLAEQSLQSVINEIKSVVGPSGWLSADADIAPYLCEQRGLYRGSTGLVVRPTTTQQVSKVMTICSRANVPVIPQGGNTGLCGGAVPPADGLNIVLCLSRMRSIRSVDPGNFTITVDAGCILAEVQQAADQHDRLFPLSLGAEGSCQIGGNLSTNAGGMQVLRYGNMRELTLGLEVVLADGRVLDCLRALRKDNTGYDLKQLFIGAEGTLGVITGATLRLFPKPVSVTTAYVSLPTLQSVISLLSLSRMKTGDQLTAFEFMPRFGVDIAVRNIHDIRDPLPGEADWYVLMELSSSVNDGHLDIMLETLLEDALEAGLIIDAAVASNDSQRAAMWRVREALVEAQKFEGASIKFDVSVPVMSIPEFIPEASQACLEVLPSVRPLAFGHCGDGNVHFNLAAPVDDDGRFGNWTPVFNTVVFDIVEKYRGSISAEHGIGLTKREALGVYKSDIELDVMRAIKAALDPLNTLNPDKVIPIRL
ncbi:FAD-binding oxidoreductase [Pollutimonas thiosulfatoxidans]|uniref:Hydroxyacid dehydrogenase n=1 Tax=Pollutimonas thiosulfatoxidans TaxID=2028345 RepID=A0A410G8Q4_9BURK|nr:FAD-binding oxidoreductase [Pollutimonas thiosulfatoxidans]QAA92651.1 hydroxyacid dehydrogenase [Pollutimonas thiosulfatoxidans]